jgi:hypothetical protein
MTQNQIDKLEALKNYGSRYEIILERGAERVRLAYTSRKSGRGLRDAIHKNGAELVAFCGSEKMELGGRPMEYLIGGWSVRFSGRTQREAIQAGELAWFRAEESK